jgi:hypothetical protein
MKSSAARKQVQSEVVPPAPAESTAPTPDVVMTEMIETLVRERAYELYLERGGEEGLAENDWYQAEREVLQRLNNVAA